ncbi:hypothetical protein C343_04041 [Cryptococcus neoformans C23]|uniref:N-acetyltransferase domain-containing protein n=3 Tax=Cryptococcus neoformans TaxID=5207 RepID=A0A854QIJ2_CRYNE|nr:hypothetical protein CNAG_06650 [Cryptococcus neoformans var. grubii H99]AUB25795.1 hypothetical protein CKF44_06650 [Cryptococcus neoformans var. grubii]OWZ30950.1 hypothetical protein C347_04102 [Cryptococcus neoformans var. grubii AD2-60a]OWZ40113.1 hypothetical protein C353_03951 [Cryptococcus neoformans var. grubii AD1-83a]OWZ43005.1 hypothetical protein C343_04041 [Cryptococcus neoformans var. grubii C23]OWZ53661.1 hypothetical protein C368_04043 [Cryptococcus neoformans var. grubii 1|eukprot:XP_012050756.1 hypothetical protein CNAG_06650 [Cryptococcus neoformans var. grubii H99]
MTIVPNAMATTVSCRYLDLAKADDFEQAVEVMTKSFSRMPTWSRFYLGTDWRRARAKVIYYLQSTSEVGEIWATERWDGPKRVIESVIAFVPPGKAFQQAPSATVTRDAFIRTLGVETVSPAPETVMFTSPSYSSNKVMNDSWMITLIGTVPEAGGRGLATKLISLVLDRAKIEDTGVCVPTTYKPRMKYYEKLGFELLEIKAGSNDLGDGAIEFMMYCPLKK